MTEEAKRVIEVIDMLNKCNDTPCYKCKMLEFNGHLACEDEETFYDYVAEMIKSLSEQLEQVTRERDAAMESVNARRACTDCAFDDFTQIGIPECRTCDRGSNWQWRGVEVEG